MADLVRAIVPTANGNRIVTVGRAHAENKSYEIREGEPTVTAAGNPQPVTRPNGRPTKKKTTVAQAAAVKKAAKSADPTDNPPF